MGITEAEYLQQLGKPVTPERAGQAFVSLATGEVPGGAYLLTAEGCSRRPEQQRWQRQESSGALKQER